MYRTFPPSVSGGCGGNTDVRQLVKGTRLQSPVYVDGANFSAGDGHMAQGDGEITGTAIETLMSATLRFSVIKNSVITPRAYSCGNRNPHGRGHRFKSCIAHHENPLPGKGFSSLQYPSCP
jgi:acetamidase/formamidase